MDLDRTENSLFENPTIILDLNDPAAENFTVRRIENISIRLRVILDEPCDCVNAFFKKLCKFLFDGRIHCLFITTEDETIVYLLLRCCLYFLSDEDVSEDDRLAVVKYYSPMGPNSLEFKKSLVMAINPLVLEKNRRWRVLRDIHHENIPIVNIAWPHISPRLATSMIKLLEHATIIAGHNRMFEALLGMVCVSAPKLVLSIGPHDLDPFLKVLALARRTAKAEHILSFEHCLLTALTGTQRLAIVQRSTIADCLETEAISRSVETVFLSTEYHLDNSILLRIFLKYIHHHVHFECIFNCFSVNRFLVVMNRLDPELGFLINEQVIAGWKLEVIRIAFIDRAFTLLEQKGLAVVGEERREVAQLLEMAVRWVTNPMTQMDCILRWCVVAESDLAASTMAEYLQGVAQTFCVEREAQFRRDTTDAGEVKANLFFQRSCDGVRFATEKDYFIAQAMIIKFQRGSLVEGEVLDYLEENGELDLANCLQSYRHPLVRAEPVTLTYFSPQRAAEKYEYELQYLSFGLR